MARTEDSKKKLLLLQQLFLKETDEEHPISLKGIQAFYEKHGLSAERKSVYSDIHALQDSGMDINLSPNAAAGYYLGSRDFELSELKLLVDAVQSCRFLTDQKSMELIAKLSALCSRSEAGQLKRQVTVSGRAKSMNKETLYNIDWIHSAISENKQINFRYFNWGLNKEKVYRDHDYTVSPCALCWDNENYYLVAYVEGQDIRHYRVDKMSSIKILDTPRVHNAVTQQLDMAAYSRHVFGMFRGEETSVRLRFKKSLSGVVVDRFGHDSMLIPDGPEHFTVTVSVSLSQNFYSWLTEFGGDVKILYPEKAVKEYRELLQASLAQYE